MKISLLNGEGNRKVCGVFPEEDLIPHLERIGIGSCSGFLLLRSDLLTRQPLHLLGTNDDTDGTAALTVTGKPWNHLCVLTDPEGLITGFQRNPTPDGAETNLCLAGACWFRECREARNDLEETVIAAFEAGARIRAMLLPERAFIVCSAEEQLRASHWVLTGGASPPVPGCEPDRGRFIQGEVHENTQLRGTLWTEPGSRVEEGCCLENCVILENAVVGRGSRLRNAVVEAFGKIRPGTVMEDKYPSFLGEEP